MGNLAVRSPALSLSAASRNAARKKLYAMAGSAGAARAGQSQPTEDYADEPHHHGHDGPG